MEISFIILISLIVNTISAYHMSEYIQNIYLRRLMILPPFGLLALLIFSIVMLSMIAIEIFRELWN
jgi:hypothetical protein